MSRGAGLAIGAAIVSATIGVLVGLVLYVGQSQRADTGPTVATEGGTSSVSFSGMTLGAVSPSATAQAPITTAPVDTAASGDTPTAQSSLATTTRSPSLTAASMITTTQNPSGTNAAGASCAALAARSSDDAGTTLYCQRDLTDHTLRWRAVVDRGGCLSRNMTGVGADGLRYDCRLDTSGHNHWVRAARPAPSPTAATS